PRPQRRDFGPAAAEVVAAEQVRRLGPGEDPHAVAGPGTRETVHVLLGEALVATLPRVPAVFPDEHRAVLHPREDRAALRLDQDRVDVLVGQRAMGDV